MAAKVNGTTLTECETEFGVRYPDGTIYIAADEEDADEIILVATAVGAAYDKVTRTVATSDWQDAA